MTLKMIAIGLLALMGLSSVMSPKTFRRFMGGLGALCMALFIGFLVTGNHSKEGPTMFGSLMAKVQKVAGLRPNWWNESANDQSLRIVNRIKNGETGDPEIQDLLPDDPRTRPEPKRSKAQQGWLAPKPIPVNLKSFNEEKTVEAIQESIESYLANYKKYRPNDTGVDRLNHRNLDPGKLKWAALKTPGGVAKDANGNTLFWLGFDEEYAKHVREQGRKLVIKERLWPMAYMGGMFVGFLLLSYATLKTLNRRAEPIHDQDYLKNSNISMV